MIDRSMSVIGHRFTLHGKRVGGRANEAGWQKSYYQAYPILKSKALLPSLPAANSMFATIP